MRVLVTGASGRIGANIVRELTQNGHQVRAGIRPGTGRVEKLRPFPVEVVEADLRDPAALAMAVDGADAVVHNGVIFSSEPAEMVGGSLNATAALLEAARVEGCRRFVFISSTAVYEGTAYRPGDPVREDEAGPCIGSVYGACKLAAEALCNAYRLQYGLPTISLRLPMVTAGAELLAHGFLLETWKDRMENDRDLGRSGWQAVVEWALEGGKRIAVPLNKGGTPWTRHFCDVRDAARAVRLALEASDDPCGAFNIASVPIQYSAAAVYLREVSGWETAEIPAPEDYRYEFSLHRAADFLGYSPAFSAREMIPDAWRQRQGEEIPGLIPP